MTDNSHLAQLRFMGIDSAAAADRARHVTRGVGHASRQAHSCFEYGIAGQPDGRGVASGGVAPRSDFPDIPVDRASTAARRAPSWPLSRSGDTTVMHDTRQYRDSGRFLSALKPRRGQAMLVIDTGRAMRVLDTGRATAIRGSNGASHTTTGVPEARRVDRF